MSAALLSMLLLGSVPAVLPSWPTPLAWGHHCVQEWKVWVRAGSGRQGGDPLGYFFQMHMDPLRQAFQSSGQCALSVPGPLSRLLILFASAVTQDIPAGRQPRGHIVLP